MLFKSFKYKARLLETPKLTEIKEYQKTQQSPCH